MPNDVGPGHNLPDLTEELKERHGAWLAEVEAFIQTLGEVPSVITNDAELTIAHLFVKNGTGFTSASANKHSAEKAPHLKAGKDIDDFFNKGVRDKVSSLVVRVKNIASAYLAEKERLRRQAEQEAADAARATAEEAQNKAAALESKGKTLLADVTMEQGEVAERTAQRHEVQASRSATDLSRTSLAGGTASVRYVWKASTIDREKLDLEALRPFFPDSAFDEALRSFIKAGRRTIAGAVIKEEPIGNFR